MFTGRSESYWDQSIISSCTMRPYPSLISMSFSLISLSILRLEDWSSICSQAVAFVISSVGRYLITFAVPSLLYSCNILVAFPLQLTFKVNMEYFFITITPKWNDLVPG